MYVTSPTTTRISSAAPAAAMSPAKLGFEDAERRVLRELDDALTEALMESFPASDPVSSLRLA